MSTVPSAPISVLFVEDTTDLLEAFQKLLEAAGFAVLTAENGEKAWELFVTVSPGIIAPNVLVTDIRLPEVNGLELIRRVRALGGNPVPIIAISGEHEATLREAKASGADVTLLKPVDPNDLIDAINRLTAR